MNIKVSDILREKFNSIQSRIPVRFISGQSTKCFHEIFDHKLKQLEHSPLPKQDINARYAQFTGVEGINRSKQLAYIDKIINNTAQKYGVDTDLVRSIVKAESAYNPYALSSKGAMGIMQLMPDTAKVLGIKNPWNIVENIDGGVRFFKEKLQQFNGNTELALAAYNAGPNSVIKYEGIPPFEETRNYVQKVLSYYNEYIDNNLKIKDKS